MSIAETQDKTVLSFMVRWLIITLWNERRRVAKLDRPLWGSDLAAEGTSFLLLIHMYPNAFDGGINEQTSARCI